MSGLFGRRKAGKGQAPPDKAQEKRTKEEDAIREDETADAVQGEPDGDDEDVRGGMASDAVLLDDELYESPDSDPDDPDEGIHFQSIPNEDAEDAVTGSDGTAEKVQSGNPIYDDTYGAGGDAFTDVPLVSTDEEQDEHGTLGSIDDLEDAGLPEAQPDPEDVPSGKHKKERQKEPMSEPKRQLIFTCGCAAAAVCCISFVLFGAVSAYKIFRPKPSSAYAWQGNGVGNAYYDSGGTVHVNVYIKDRPNTEVTLYMLADGTVVTEAPDDGTPAEPITVYIDSNGNASAQGPVQAGATGGTDGSDQVQVSPDDDGTSGTDEPSGTEAPASSSEPQESAEGQVPSETDAPVAEQTPETDGSGNVAGTPVGGSPASASPSPEATAPPDGGSTGSVSGTPTGVKPEGSGTQQGGSMAQSGSEQDGDKTAGQPSDAEPNPDTDAQPDDEQPSGSGTGQQANSGSSYDGMTEAQILAEAEARREAGEGYYLDTDKVYKVQFGDTLSKISGKLGFSVDFLAAYNGLNSRDLIRTGESIRYPARK